MMPEEGKTDSESSCSFFGKRKAVIRKNALCLRRKRTRKAVVSSSKKKSGYPKECITFAENIPRTPSTGIPYPVFFETPSAGAPPFCLTSSATSLQDAPHLSASRHLPRYRGSLPRFNGGIRLRKPGKRQGSG